ncbi:NUC173 domain-containing protein [Phialemonium atrogriseum]|uniref:NUC173 domain-containing protein n=1 Tax=Phialemonium atrogriseum TaxID=1093897 RepID=A0AAJ0FKH5_9PEZI|nr:NUC173 domain-containing protein [Phialemonium atrogriseum]KAK1765569.1 NUC173 domain-containing protein [Phialemonium atrogriseum]
MPSVPLAEKLDKIRSPNLQSQQQTAVVLAAVESTLKDQNTEATPTAYFAALLALLSQATSDDAQNKALPTSVVYLLDIVTPFAPHPLLRAKFTQILSLLAPVISHPEADAPTVRPSIGCLESLLIAQDSAAWELSTAQIGPRRAIAALLTLALDHRPKVRKRAQDALKSVLKAPPPSPSLDHPAAGMCAETAMKSLADLAEQGVRMKKEKKGVESVNSPDLIHALQLVKTIASASGGWPSKKIEDLCELLLGIARTGNEHMTMAVFDIFDMIFEGMADEIASSKLPRLLEIISELRPAANDTQLLPPWIAILSRGYDVFAQIEPEETFQQLPDLFVLVSEFMESHSKNIRISASECMISFAANCIPAQVILEPSIYDEKILEKLAKVLEGLLTVKYQSAWEETFNVIGAMFDSLRWRAYPYLSVVTGTIGEMRGNDAFAGKKEADVVLGKAVRAMGPEAVLNVLPLNLAKPVKGQPGRAWMLPLLRDYTANTRLAHFKTELVPLSEIMFQRVLDHGEAPKTMEVKIYETVVQQIWSILPGYCDLPLDLTEAFDQGFAEMLANLLYQQVDLRLDVCRALKALVESNQAIASIDEEEDLILQSRVTKADAQKNLDYLGTFSGNFLAVLFNVYGATMPQSRGPILQTINAYLSVTPPKELMETFDRVCKMFASALQEETPKKQGEKPEQSASQTPSTTHTLMDLVITMAIYLPRDSFGTLFEIATLVIFKDDDPQLQKKAYKLIPRLADSPTGKAALEERHEELQALLVTSAEKVSAPARRERLAAISAFLPLLPNTSLHFIPSILSEVVISCKEQNERARSMAFDLLVQMGEKMAAADGAMIDNSKAPHMPKDAPAAAATIEEYVTMVSAGLAGSTPHMISASITAITRILYEFRESLSTSTLADLVQTMDLFLTSNNREIVKSVLGFVKVCVISLPTEMVQPRLVSLIPNLMIWSHEHKGHFRAKVKHILERMVRRFGFEAVNTNCPEPDRKLINNIRKTKERAKKRKGAAKDEDGEDSGEGGEEGPSRRAGRFESEYDQALYSSDDSEAEAADSDDEVIGRAKRPAAGRKGGNTYIVEDDNEPLDLLDRKALASISSTKPVKLRRAGRSKAKTDVDGRLILGGQNGDDGGAMDIDAEGGEETGVGAYVAALKGKDAPKKGLRGKLKWSNKKSRDDDDDDEDDGDEMEVDSGAAAYRARPGHGNRGGPVSRGRGMARGRGGTRAGRGGIASGRRGLGEDKRSGPPMNGRVGKPRAGGRGGSRGGSRGSSRGGGRGDSRGGGQRGRGGRR